MKNLYFKIYEYDAESKRMKVAFCSNESKHNIEEYPIFDYQLNNVDNDDPDAALEEIISFGVHVATKHDKLEKLTNSSAIDKELSSLVGKTSTVDLETKKISKK